MGFFRWLLSSTAFFCVIPVIPTDTENRDALFTLSIIHMSDFHARFDEVNEKMFPCMKSDVCIGGIARVKTVVDNLKAQRENVLFLNAGDNYQGTFWYTVFRHNVTSHFLNLLAADAITLGNHEFTHKIDGLIPFLKSIASPVIVANIDATNEPDFQNLYRKSIVVERSGRKIGIIGVILREVAEIAKTGKLKFTSEIDAIRNESMSLRQKGVNIIVVLSHCGLDRDREIAYEVGDHVDVIVGGHSHTFLYTTSDDGKYPGQDVPSGPYPIVVTPRADTDRKVLIVHASAFTKYVGNLRVSFNAAGHVQVFEGNPIFLSNAIEKDAAIETELAVWREEVNKQGQRVVGHTNVDLIHRECRHGECKLGSFATDAFVHETQIEFPEITGYAAIIQAAGMRSSLRQGPITHADIVSFMPFEDTLDIVELKGDVLHQVFEHSVSKSFVDYEFIGIHMLQISGIHVVFNTTLPAGQRVQSLNIKVNNHEYERVRNNKFYTIILPAFLANGSDGFSMIKLNRRNHRIGLLDVDIMEKYIRRKSPFTVDGASSHRIVMLT